MISVSDNFLVESVVYLQNKICPFLVQDTFIYVGHFIYDSQLNVNSPNLSFSLNGE